MDSYSALQDDDVSDRDTLEDFNPKPESASGDRRMTTVVVWALAVTLICTVVNIGTAIWLPTTRLAAPQSISSMTRREMRLLRRPNQYIGLEKVPRPFPPTAPSFTNYPIVILPVDSANPNEVFDHDPMRYSSQVGTITPEDKRVIITNTVSTIVQFRAVDFGMESCELNIFLPALSKLQDTPSSSAISVHIMNMTYALDTDTLSYSTRPSRFGKLVDIAFDQTNDVHWHRKFNCPTESLLTFELSCSTSRGHGCNVEWWQNKSSDVTVADSAIFVTQHATV